jgi:flagellar FliL protein
MVNLLFISSNPKIDIIKKALQPSLKIKIDFVGDFDIGLKEVFDKRAALVFIQDQIAGVTGENVARHIQLLLGSGAPAFVFMHEGNPKAKPIKGLCDHLIDLSQDDTALLADIQATLKLLLGAQWQKLYVPPKANVPDLMPTPVVPEGHRVNADIVEENSISNLRDVTQSFDNNNKVPDIAEPETSTELPLEFMTSTLDQLKEVTEAAASTHKNKKIVTATAIDPGIKNISGTPETAASSDNLVSTATSQQISLQAAHDATAVSEKSPSTLFSPVDLRRERESIAEEVAMEESLRVLEANYLSKTRAKKRYQAIAVAVILGLIGGSWYLFKQTPHPTQTVVKESIQANVPGPVTSAPVVQQSISSTQRMVPDVLPSFIPLAGHDRAFALQKPGWERYVGTDSEFRVFRSDGKLKAVQVLATNGHVISESRLKTILIELTGTGEYGISSHEQKFGFQVSRATVNRKADLLIYRKKSAVHAFVVSLD